MYDIIGIIVFITLVVLEVKVKGKVIFGERSCVQGSDATKVFLENFIYKLV